MIGTASFRSRQDQSQIINLSIVYKVRFSEKVAIVIEAVPEAARVEQDIIVSTAGTEFLNIPRQEQVDKSFTI